MTYFVSLRIVAIIIGLLYIAVHLPGVLAPHWLVRRAKTFPRNYPLGIVLMLGATLWFVILTGVMDLGELSNLRFQMMAVWTLAGVAVVIFVPGFLALRGLGCLLLLGAALVLDATFLAQTPARYFLTVLAYFWVILGMVLVYSPHLGRDGLEKITATAGRCRLFSWPGITFGVLLLVLGLFVYP